MTGPRTGLDRRTALAGALLALTGLLAGCSSRIPRIRTRSGCDSALTYRWSSTLVMEGMASSGAWECCCEDHR